MRKVVQQSWGFAVIALVTGLAVILMTPAKGICRGSDDEGVDQQETGGIYSGEVEDLRLKADAEAREANQAAFEDIQKTEAIKRTRYLEELGYVPKGNLLSDKEREEIEQQRTKKLEAIRGAIGAEIKTVQTIEPQQPQEQTAQNAQQAEEASKRRTMPGMLNGIVLYNKKSAALVEGRIVRENDKVRDIRVLKITKDYVEFERQGKTWRQMVGQFPPAYWAEAAPAKESAPAQQAAPVKQPANGQKTGTKK
jgi:hypothetical protein